MSNLVKLWHKVTYVLCFSFLAHGCRTMTTLYSWPRLLSYCKATFAQNIIKYVLNTVCKTTRKVFLLRLFPTKIRVKESWNNLGLRFHAEFCLPWILTLVAGAASYPGQDSSNLNAIMHETGHTSFLPSLPPVLPPYIPPLNSWSHWSTIARHS